MPLAVRIHDARRASATRLAWFFAGAFALAWIPWLAVILIKGTSTHVALIGLFAPALSALTVAGLKGGRAEVSEMLARLWRFRFKLRWWLLAIFLMPVTYGIAAFATEGRDVRLLLNASSWWFLPLSFAYLLVVTAGEEIGWRGYALPLLLKTRASPLAAAIGLGVLWGVWHIPLRIASGLSAFPLPLYILFTVALSVVYLVLLQRSGGSLVPALLLHTSTDIAPRVIDVSKLPSSFWLAAVIILLIAIVLLWSLGAGPTKALGENDGTSFG